VAGRRDRLRVGLVAQRGRPADPVCACRARGPDRTAGTSMWPRCARRCSTGWTRRAGARPVHPAASSRRRCTSALACVSASPISTASARLGGVGAARRVGKEIEHRHRRVTNEAGHRHRRVRRRGRRVRGACCCSPAHPRRRYCRSWSRASRPGVRRDPRAWRRPVLAGSLIRARTLWREPGTHPGTPGLCAL